MIDIELLFDNIEEINIEIEEAEQQELSIDLEEGTMVVGETLPEYDGGYSITPTVESQTFNTKNTAFRQDLQIKAIPFYETSNVYGTTITIA